MPTTVVLLIMLVLLILVFRLDMHERHLARLEHRMIRRDRPRATQRLPSAHSSASTRAPIHSHPQDHTSPPSYDSLSRGADLETTRARNPPKRTLNAPIPTDSPIEEAYLAAATALIGLSRSSQDETYSSMFVARAAQAVSVAASTSKTYPAFLAAVNAVELLSMLDYEHDCGRMRLDVETERKGLVNLIDAAVRQSLA
ncbi:hypothetical protein N8I77_013674 [Diaporthe amygdali]|uniref:Transmembrane protein n=1 Tax=Phomopsis amygdali TaxID=1214568 RepID=A0AAD9VWN4_PHOAM|nr:hypothetical protein N8I77_013674 [Diaporthe amygdali]